MSPAAVSTDTPRVRFQALDAAKLTAISADLVAAKLTRDEARAAVIDVIIHRNHCSRVSLWRFDLHAGGLALLCFAAKTAGGELCTDESRLEQAEFCDYFDILATQGVYASSDAMNDPHLQPMREHYLLRYGVLSMLDAAFLVNGRVYGVVCCEQTDAVRVWRPNEITNLRANVAKLAMLLAAADDPILWGSPSLPMVPLRPEPAQRRR